MSDDLNLSDLGPDLSRVEDHHLLNEYLRRNEMCVLASAKKVGDDKCRHIFSYTGSLYAAIGLAEVLKESLLGELTNPPEEYEEDD